MLSVPEIFRKEVMEKRKDNLSGAGGEQIIMEKIKKPFLKKRNKNNLTSNFKKEEKTDESIF